MDKTNHWFLEKEKIIEAKEVSRFFLIMIRMYKFDQYEGLK